MITEQVMSTGSWDINLKPTTPYSLRQKLDFGSVIWVTPNYEASLGLDIKEIKTQAVYGGMLTKRAVRAGHFSGTSLVGFFQLSSSSPAYIPDYWTFPGTPFTFAKFMAGIGTPGLSTNGITAGAGFSASTTTVTTVPDFSGSPGFKDVLDSMASLTGNVYRVEPTGVINWGKTATALDSLGPIRQNDAYTATHLFKTRQLCVTPEYTEGMYGDWMIMNPIGWGPDASCENYRSQAVVWNKTGNTKYVVANNIAPGDEIGFTRFDGGGAVIYNNSEKLSGPSDDAAQMGIIAQTNANAFVRPTYGSNDCKVNLYAPPMYLYPGDQFFIYDPVEGMVGTDNFAVPGAELTPVLMDLTGYTWPIEAGMGVFANDPTSRSVVYDLTPFMEFETGPTTLKVNTPDVSTKRPRWLPF